MKKASNGPAIASINIGMTKKESNEGVDSKMSEEMTFMNQLKEDIQTQDQGIQADPAFWVIRQYETIPTHDEFADGMMYFYNDGDLTIFETFEEMFDVLHNQVQADEAIIDETINHIQTKRGDHGNHYTLYDAVEYARDYVDDRSLNMYPYIKVPVIQENTFFLTRKDAEEHLELNHYHYNATAHTYMMTAWRSPSYAKLIKYLKNSEK